METNTPTGKWQIIIKFSIIYALTGIGVSVILYILGMNTQRTLVSITNLLIAAAIIFFAIRGRRDESQNGFISYGQGVGTGMLVALFGGFAVSLYFIIFTQFIDPDFMANMVENTKREMIEKGDSEEKIEQTMSIMSKMQSPLMMFVFGLLGALFQALIISLILSIFTRKENPDGLYNTLDNQ